MRKQLMLLGSRISKRYRLYTLQTYMEKYVIRLSCIEYEMTTDIIVNKVVFNMVRVLFIRPIFIKKKTLNYTLY